MSVSDYGTCLVICLIISLCMLVFNFTFFLLSEVLPKCASSYATHTHKKKTKHSIPGTCERTLCCSSVCVCVCIFGRVRHNRDCRIWWQTYATSPTCCCRSTGRSIRENTHACRRTASSEHSQTARALYDGTRMCAHTHIPIYKLRVVGRLAHTHTHTNSELG